MPVEKYRDLDAARRALWTSPDDPALARRIRALWELAARLAPPSAPRGVQKFRSIEAANRERDERLGQRVRELADRRARESLP